MRSTSLFALASAVGGALAQVKGFNYGSTFTDGTAKMQSDWQNEFTTAQNLVGTSGFASARLYTMIQGNTANTPISAIPAAINTKTTLLLGLWASAGQANINNELAALSAAVTQYGAAFANLVVGISVGSEDLYRISPTGIAGNSGAGAEPNDIVTYIGEVRNVIKGTVLANVPVGHVDTWTAWVNGSNNAVTAACDFIGFDAYPYFQNTMSNGIENGAALLQSAYDQTLAAVGNKPLWVTETGWPVSGPTENLAVPSIPNAQTYWDQVGCNMLFGKVNTWWYTLQDAYPTTPAPSFGIVGTQLSTTPMYNLTCPAGSSGASSSSSAIQSATTTVAPVSTQSGAPPASTSISENPVPSASYASGSATSAPVATSSNAAPTTTTAVMTTGSTVTVAGGKTSTVYQTTIVTITSCPAGCSTTLASATSAPATASTAKASASASASSCPANISGNYQFPHLIVPVSSASPNTAYGTQYDATINSTVSTIFNFDIPASYAGLTCSLIFLFPVKSQLTTSSYTFNNQGGLVSNYLSGVATTSTTYNNAPASAVQNGAIPALVSGNSYVISTDKCPAGSRVSFELSATGGLALEYFQDYNDGGVGLYVSAC